MLFLVSYKRHIITLRGEPRTCVDVVKKKRKRAFARNRTSVNQPAFSKRHRKTNRFCFVKMSVHFYPYEIYSEPEIISSHGMSRSLSSQDITADNSASYFCRNFTTSFPTLIFPAWVILLVISLSLPRASFIYSEKIK